MRTTTEDTLASGSLQDRLNGGVECKSDRKPARSQLAVDNAFDYTTADLVANVNILDDIPA